MMENQKKKLGAKGMKIWRGAVGGRGRGSTETHLARGNT
jgi:hypothetical protein